MLEMGYVRNPAARALRSQRSHMVGLLIPTLEYALYASLVNAASSQFSTAGISTLIATFGYDLDKEFKEARLLLEHGAEALVLVGGNHRPELHKMLKQHGVPFINTYVYDRESAFPSVGFDNEAAAAKVTKHLVQLGHRAFGVVSGITKDNDRTTNRLKGIRRELSLSDLVLPPSMIVECPYSISDGRKACAHILSQENHRPTALVCGNDILAFGALIECEARGLDVPGDISIVGFDNLELSKHANTPLTTIDVPAEEMGASAANYILGKLDGTDIPQHNPVDVQLILRGSSAPPKSV